MTNLAYVTRETRTKVTAILNNPAIHNSTKQIISAGLNKDCLDAARDAQLAADTLKLVMLDLI